MPVNVQAANEVIRQLRDSGFTAESLLGNVDVFLKAMQQTTATNKQAQQTRQELTAGLRAGGAPSSRSEAQDQIRALIHQHRATVDIVNASQAIGEAIRGGNAVAQLDAARVLRETIASVAAVRETVRAGREMLDILEAQGDALEALTVELKTAIATGNVAEQKRIADKIATITNEVQKTRIKKLVEDVADAQVNISGKLAILFKSGGPFLYPNKGVEAFVTMVAAGSKGKAVWHELGLGPNKHPVYVSWPYTASQVLDMQHATSSWVVAYYLVDLTK